jgi:hypothetical protein
MMPESKIINKQKVKENLMKRNTIIAIIVIILAIILVIIFSWSKDSNKASRGRIFIKEKPPLPVKPVITKVELVPAEPSSLDFIQAKPVLKDRDMLFVKYSYQWYVNDNPIGGSDTVLDRKYFKKGDDVYCRIKAVRGKIEGEPVDSDEVTIRNSPPMANLLPIPDFDVPGEFSYTINADDPDGDSLTYRLLEPLDRGIIIDKKTGLIRWYITGAPATENQDQPTPRPEDENNPGSKRPEPEEIDSTAIPPSIMIIFEISDGDDSVQGSIELNLEKGSEIPK